MKKFLVLSISLLLVFSFVTPAAAQAEISVIVNGEELSFGEQSPFIVEGTTLAPARTLLEALGFTIVWDEEESTIFALKGSQYISLQDGYNIAIVDDVEHALLQEVIIIDGHTYAPLRFISEAAGYEVSWEGSSRTITIDVIERESSEGFLWKVDHDDNTVYLLGSIHIADESMYPLNPKIEEAFAASDYLVVEVDILNMGEEQQQLMLELMMYEEGSSLSDHISAETYLQLDELFMNEFGISVDDLSMFKPWVITDIVLQEVITANGYVAELGIDFTFLLQAMALGVPILELESVQSQLEMIANMSDELQEQLLLEMLEEYDEAGETLEFMMDMWKTGDEEALMYITLASDDDEYNQALLVDRNIDMADQIEVYLNDDEPTTYFVVIGAAHMLAEFGIIELLEEKGFTVEKQ